MATMYTFEERHDETAEEQSLFPTAVSEEELDEAMRKELVGSNNSSLAPGQKRPQRLELQGSFIVQSKAAEHYRNGNEAMGKSQYEKAVICFSKAITLQPEQIQLHVSLAEAYLQLCDFQSAAACYKRAWLLQPGSCSARLAFIYNLQGQCLFDRGLFLEALEAFSKATEVKPGRRAYKVKSLACLTAAGHHDDCLKLLNDWLSEGPTSDLYVLRARLHKLLNQTSQCYRDVKSALELNPACAEAAALLQQLQAAGEQARQKAVDRALTGQLPEALCMINVALENCPRDARLYLLRGILYRRLKEFAAALKDLVQAVELSMEEKEEEKEEEEEVRGQAEAREEKDEEKEKEEEEEEEVRGQAEAREEKDEEKEEEEEVRGQAEAREEKDEQISVEEEARFQLIVTYNDFAIQCFDRGLYAEATLLLNEAIEGEKGEPALYLNRGDCFFQQDEWSFALADYQQAEEMMQPDDPTAWLRLAALQNAIGCFYFQDGCFQDAADMFSEAIRDDPAAALYYENRSKTFRKLLYLEGARKDFICSLILDPTNEELLPMRMSLFPGCSMSDVLSSSEGQAVRAQLMDAIESCGVSSDQQRLSEELQKMTLTNESTASQLEDPPEAGKELKLCVDQQET